MKTFLSIMIISMMLFLFSLSAEAVVYVSGSTGADGAFNPPTQVPPGTVVDLVNNIVTVPLPPNGIFNFTTVDIPAAITVKFVRNTANTPVYMLTSSNVNINGIIDISGENGMDGGPADGVKTGPILGGKGGPGGFDGGCGGEPERPGIPAKEPGYGLGPGGAGPGVGGCYSTEGSIPPWIFNPPAVYSCYGNNELQPLIGGSGGGGTTYCSGYPGCFGYGGGGGGGALLVASSSSITIGTSGQIKANAGAGGTLGSGGSIKLIANKVIVNGQITALANLIFLPSNCWFWCTGYNQYISGQGRVRIEAYYYVEGAIYPSPSIAMPGAVFVSQIPSLSITSIAGAAVPATTTGSYTTPDISLPSTITNPISISISAANIPVGTTVNVSAVPQSGSSTSATATLAGTDTSSTATASLSISTTYPSVITAQTTFTIQTAMYYDGEKIEKVKVASTVGGSSKVAYITKSGKEIPAEIVLAGLMK